MDYLSITLAIISLIAASVSLYLGWKNNPNVLLENHKKLISLHEELFELSSNNLESTEKAKAINEKIEKIEKDPYGRKH